MLRRAPGDDEEKRGLNVGRNNKYQSLFFFGGGVPYYNCSRMGPKPPIVVIKASILVMALCLLSMGLGLRVSSWGTGV